MKKMKQNKEQTRKQKERQVELNFEAFSEKLPELIKTQLNKYALMRNGEIIETYDSYQDAYKTGVKINCSPSRKSQTVLSI